MGKQKRIFYIIVALCPFHRFSVFSVVFRISALVSQYSYKDYDLIYCIIWSFRLCIFCGKKDDSFTDEGLDIHYWKHCPMLRRCAECKQVGWYILWQVFCLFEWSAQIMFYHQIKPKDLVDSFALCSQVVEIASLTEHLLSECENKSKFSQCPRCSEAVPTEELTQHVQGSTCNCESSVHCCFMPLVKMFFVMKSWSLLYLFVYGVFSSKDCIFYIGKWR